LENNLVNKIDQASYMAKNILGSRWPLIILIVIIVILIGATVAMWGFDIGFFGPVEPSDPKFKYPQGKNLSSKKNVMSDEAKVNIQKNIDALKAAQDAANRK
jgi:hypothetical protein